MRDYEAETARFMKMLTSEGAPIGKEAADKAAEPKKCEGDAGLNSAATPLVRSPGSPFLHDR